MTEDGGRHPCPCCGYLVNDEPPGSHAMCPVCRWEDDLTQLRWPRYTDGANEESLIEAQRNFAEFGASRPRSTAYARRPAPGERQDTGFRPIDLSIDDFEDDEVQEAPWPDDRTVLYWWRSTFWRRRPE